MFIIHLEDIFICSVTWEMGALQNKFVNIVKLLLERERASYQKSKRQRIQTNWSVKSVVVISKRSLGQLLLFCLFENFKR